MNKSTFMVRFPGSSDADANVLARSFADYVKEEIPPDSDFSAEPKRAKPGTQDFGATVVLILGTTAVTALAKGIAAWLKGHTGTTMEIVTPRGAVVVRNV